MGISGLEIGRGQDEAQWRLLLSVADTLRDQDRPLDERLNDICRHVASTLRIPATAILLADGEQKHLVLRGAHGLSLDYVRVINAERTLGLAGRPERWAPTVRAFATGSLVTVPDVSSDDAFVPWREAARAEGYASFLSVPLEADGRMVGCLNGYGAEPGRFGRREERLLRLLAHFLGVATELVQLNGELARKMRLLDRSERLHKALTGAVSEKDSLGAVADTLTGLLDGEVVILDRALRPEAKSDGIDEAELAWVRRQLARRAGASGPEEGPFALGGRGRAAIAAASRVGGRPLGYVVLVKAPKRFHPLDIRGVEHAATVAALVFSHRQADREERLRRGAHLVNEVLDGRPIQGAGVERTAGTGGEPIEGACRVLLAQRSGGAAGTPWPPETPGSVSEILEACGVPHLVGERGSVLVVVAASGDRREERLLVSELGRLDRHGGGDGTPWVAAGGEAPSLDRVAASFHQAEQALEVATALGIAGGVVRYEDLGIHRFLLNTRAPKEVRAFARKTLAPLTGDGPGGDRLLATLEAYFRHDRDVRRTAEATFLHPNTVRYRLKRAYERLGMRPGALDDQMALGLALAARRLIGDREAAEGTPGG